MKLTSSRAEILVLLVLNFKIFPARAFYMNYESNRNNSNYQDSYLTL